MKRWKRLHCPHSNVRGIYGDEINHTPGFRRNECLDCERLLDGPVIMSRDPMYRTVPTVEHDGHVYGITDTGPYDIGEV